jgi:diadenosine tetraphosphatase ApaH/serine/threonine PP2A family protein phosphatase
MRIAVISDIHGNRPALEAVLAEIGEERVDRVWCLVGNHDLAVRGDISLGEFSRGAELAARWTQETLSGENLAYLHELEPKGVERGIGLYHASPRDPVWEYVLSTLQAELCLDVQAERVCLIGHSHVALAFMRQEGNAATGEPCPEGTTLDLGEGEWLVNPGSVGQPRDGDPRAAWLMLDTSAWTAHFRRTEYDIPAAAAAIRAARLPDSLAERLQYGQ